MKVKILMSRSTANACDDLNNRRKVRYNFRARYAEGLNLNFRIGCDPIPPHGIRRFLEKHHYIPGAHGRCAVCENAVQMCTCKVEIRDASGNLIGEL
jgi:hypothetical protein